MGGPVAVQDVRDHKMHGTTVCTRSEAPPAPKAQPQLGKAALRTWVGVLSEAAWTTICPYYQYADAPPAPLSARGPKAALRAWVVIFNVRRVPPATLPREMRNTQVSPGDLGEGGYPELSTEGVRPRPSEGIPAGKARERPSSGGVPEGASDQAMRRGQALAGQKSTTPRKPAEPGSGGIPEGKQARKAPGEYRRECAHARPGGYRRASKGKLRRAPD
jgi:hypothetical protein